LENASPGSYIRLRQAHDSAIGGDFLFCPLQAGFLHAYNKDVI